MLQPSLQCSAKLMLLVEKNYFVRNSIEFEPLRFFDFFEESHDVQ